VLHPAGSISSLNAIVGNSNFFIDVLLYVFTSITLAVEKILTCVLPSANTDYDGLDMPTTITFVEDSEGQNMKPTEPPYEKLQINRTRPEPCDKEMDLYQLQPNIDGVFDKKVDEGCSRYGSILLFLCNL
jgi:hypothetical protein